MLTKTNIKTSSKEIYDLVKHLPEGKNILNEPTGKFFYDPWQLKSEWQDTALDDLLKQIPDHGEVRVIVLKPGESYFAHADIDDRYHLTLDAEQSYLIDIENEKMYPTIPDDTVYLMNTGVLHTASNYGYKNRYQLVIRKRLDSTNELHESVLVMMSVKDPVYNLRYLFDSSFSRLLNRLAKEECISNFDRINETTIKFSLEKENITELLKMQQMCGFKIEILYG